MNVVSQFERNKFTTGIRRCANDIARRGPSALGTLFDLTSVRLLRYAMTLTRSREDAEDALQAAMLRVALKPKALAGARHPWAYFLTIVRNEALNITCRKKPIQYVSDVCASWAGPADLDTVEDEDTKQQIRDAIRRLPPSQAEVVILKIWEEMTFIDIATMLDESPNTVASRYRYALEKLTHYLQPVGREAFHA